VFWVIERYVLIRVVALFTCILLVSTGKTGPSEFGYCWTSRNSTGKPATVNGTATNQFLDLNITYVYIIYLYSCNLLWMGVVIHNVMSIRSWGFFYIWLILYWIYAIWYDIFIMLCNELVFIHETTTA